MCVRICVYVCMAALCGILNSVIFIALWIQIVNLAVLFFVLYARVVIPSQ